MPPVKLTIIALRLAFKVQKIRQTPINNLLDELCNIRGLPNKASIQNAQRATSIACSIVGRLNFLCSCITKTLVMGALISDQENVKIHIGFKHSDTTNLEPEGHAWITQMGKLIEFFPDEKNFIKNHITTKTLTPSRNNRGKK